MTYTQQVVVYDHGKPTEHHQFPMPSVVEPKGYPVRLSLNAFRKREARRLPTCSRRLGLVSQRRCLLEGLRFLMNLGLG